MDLSGHLSRRKPDSQGCRVGKRSIESLARSLDDSRSSRTGSWVRICHGCILSLSGREQSSSIIRAYRSAFQQKWKFKLTHYSLAPLIDRLGGVPYTFYWGSCAGTRRIAAGLFLDFPQTEREA